MGPDLTLQINLSAGDLAYCEQTVPALVAAHRAEVRETVAVADCRRPQSTPLLHAASRFPAEEFAGRVARLRDLCARWRQSGLFDRVEFLEPADGPESLRRLNRKYCGVGTAMSHDHWGHAFSAYFAGWDCARTRYVLHYDADILLYQQAGYSWAADALARLRADATLLAASPRIAPPIPGSTPGGLVWAGRPGSGWLDSWPLESSPAGWRGSWISTRCHVMDRERLQNRLPLIPRQGRLQQRLAAGVNALLLPLYRLEIWTQPLPERGWRRFLSRAARKIAVAGIPPFPLPPEVLLAEGPSTRGSPCLYLASEQAWYVHPDTKPPVFLQLLPAVLPAVHRGRYPAAQAGLSGLQFEAWRSHFAHGTLAS